VPLILDNNGRDKMKNQNRAWKSAALAGVMIIASAGMAAAQFGTPDGLPPALEEVCDMTTGKANGLCVAYCEAMDCDSETPNANAHACENVAANYTRVTGETLPCIRTCPCWEGSELRSVTAANQRVTGGPSCVGSGGNVVIQNTPGSTPGVEGGFAVFSNAEASFCATRDLPPFGLVITAAEAEACGQQIRDRCAAIGTPIP
jgi:hypothetical protein